MTDNIPYIDTDEMGQQEQLAFGCLTVLVHAVTTNRPTLRDAVLHDQTTPVQVMLWLAIQLNHFSAIPLLQERDVDLYELRDGRYGPITPLEYAIHQCKPVVISALCKVGADPNRSDRYGCFPLEAVSTNTPLDVLIALLDAGADPHKLATDTRSAFDVLEENLTSDQCDVIQRYHPDLVPMPA